MQMGWQWLRWSSSDSLLHTGMDIGWLCIGVVTGVGAPSGSGTPLVDVTGMHRRLWGLGVPGAGRDSAGLKEGVMVVPSTAMPWGGDSVVWVVDAGQHREIM